MRPLEVVIEPSTVATIVVHVAGELDAASCSHLIEAVTSIEPGFTTVILDLHGLTFIDSTGIGSLVQVHRDLDGTARMLQLRNVSGPLQGVLEMTELHHALTIL